MKNKIATLLIFLISALGMACPLCEAKQPKGFANITHGEGPNGDIDYIIMYSAIVIVGYTLIMSIKYLARPKEKEKNHIKNLVLEEHNCID
ncbi:hypothetical protein MWU65_06345 [Cellulophaga sp. F20128]|uniref:hypothetical protein n=1 Tax=Cellulophaga sp. F20128 TaxID=2926413 RepID=UPI001FF1DDFF|nr:hypothetical protein [Cellulophaga sp. F20128]MCK0156791.1 hypothetical protein [Cellulophaga sp. F20128]